MNKKIYISLLLGLVFILSSCGLEPKVDMTYEQASDVFAQGLTSPILFDIAEMMNNPYIKEISNFQIYGENAEVKIDWKLKVVAEEDTKNIESLTNIDFDMDITDKLKKSTMTTSWNLDIMLLAQEMYFRANNFGLDMWVGSAEWNLINLVVANFLDKRIKVDDTQMVQLNKVNKEILMNNYELPKYIQTQLKENPFYNNKEKTLYEWYNAYKIETNKESLITFLSWLLKDTIISDQLPNQEDFDLEFDAYLVIKSEKKVELVIEKALLTWYWASINITANIGNKYWEINIYREDIMEEINLSWAEDIKTLQLDFSRQWWYQSPIKFYISIRPEETTTGIDYEIDWNVELSMPSLWASDILNININWLYSLNKIEPFTLASLTWYVLLSDLIWDQYALPAMIDDIPTVSQ